MRYRRFGRTELRLPVLSSGGMRFQESWSAGDPVRAATQRNLEATVERALDLGVNHLETARGYGTSEEQLGELIARLPREELVVQTKVGPQEDPDAFRRNLEDSFVRLRVDVLDLFAFHGINNDRRLDQVLRPGGCLEVARRFRDAGRIRHIGFSTHGPTRLVREAIRSGVFEYVNLHWYYIFQDNLPAIEDAADRDMGVFIISPSDKGGRLYDPPKRLVELCAPLSPMVFNDLFCLANPNVHTISIGAARPSDFDEHLAVLDLLDDPEPILAPILERLDLRWREALGEDFARTWAEGLPEWEDVPGEVNLRSILWLRNLAVAFDLVDYARMRYGFLGKDDHWFPGNSASEVHDERLLSALRRSPHADRIPDMLREAHALLC